MLICLTLALAPAVAAAEPSARITSTVRADSRSGRLIRSTTAASTPKQAGQTPERAAVQEIVETTAKEHNVDPLLVHSVIRAESNYNASAVSPKGAQGIMQLIPDTARRFGASNSFDVRENIAAGVKYLKYLQDTFKDEKLALAAYNAGEGAVQRHGNSVPPYKETEQYVERVGKFYGEARKNKQLTAAAKAATPLESEEPAAEPLRHLEVATDADGRIVLRTR